MVITELIEDKVTNKSYLIISNWGEKCIVDFDDFFHSLPIGWVSGFILIK